MATRRDAIALAFMLAGIYVWGIFGAQFVFGLVAMLVPNAYTGGSVLGPGTLPLLAFSIVPLIVIIVVGYLLIFRASALAAFLIGDQESGDAVVAWSVSDVQSTALSVMGIFFVVNALPILAGSVLQGLMLAQSEVYTQVSNGLYVSALTRVLQILTGVILFVYARRIVRLLERWQQAADAKSES